MAGLATLPAPVQAQGQEEEKSGKAARRDVIKQLLPGVPAKEITLIEVTYPPGASSPSHIHPDGVIAFVVSGSIVSKVNDGRERTYNVGDAWWEPPGAIHLVSRNASRSAPATLLAIYITPSGASAAELMKPIQ